MLLCFMLKHFFNEMFAIMWMQSEMSLKKIVSAWVNYGIVVLFSTKLNSNIAAF